MARETVTLESEQWTQLLNILTSVQLAWNATNPLIMAIGGQLQMQRQGNSHAEVQTQAPHHERRINE